MAGESAELTFVRCPFCKSLVPATSKTCRMCGESLEAQTNKDETESKKSSRIRQRTMTRPSDELQRAAQQIRDEVESSTPVKSGESYQGTSNQGYADDFSDSYKQDGNSTEDPENDPLADYIKQLQDYESEDKFSSDKQASEVMEEFLRNSQKEEVRFDMNSSENEEDPSSEKFVAESLIEASSNKESQLKATPVPDVLEPQAKVIVESGIKRGFKTGLNFSSKPKTEEVLAPVSRIEEKSKFISTKNKLQEDNVAKEVKEINKTEQKREVVAKSAKQATALTGRLVGWLVSYADSDGEAMELREGKFFISRTSLKPTDFIIDDESVSTPHALVMVTTDSLLKVQDLMSERGVFVRPRGVDTYQRAAESVEVRNGDWLRFGDVEYLLCLIAHVGEK